MRSMILCVLLMTADVAHAEKASAFVIGVGQNSCGQLIAAIGRDHPLGQHGELDTVKGPFVDEYTMYQQWLMGFVTGFNIKHASEAEQQQQVRIDPAAMDLWMRNWCNQYPTQKVYQAANAFIDEVRINAATGRR
jgi:hypothetical protein